MNLGMVVVVVVMVVTGEGGGKQAGNLPSLCLAPKLWESCILTPGPL